MAIVFKAEPREWAVGSVPSWVASSLPSLDGAQTLAFPSLPEAPLPARRPGALDLSRPVRALHGDFRVRRWQARPPPDAEGTFSEVLKAQCVKNGKMTAIKCMKSQFESEEQVNNRREIQAPRRLSP